MKEETFQKALFPRIRGEERGGKSKHSDCSTATHDYANCDEEARGRIRVSVREARACLFLRKDT